MKAAKGEPFAQGRATHSAGIFAFLRTETSGGAMGSEEERPGCQQHGALAVGLCFVELAPMFCGLKRETKRTVFFLGGGGG